MQPEYTIERWELGWVLCGNASRSGIPMNALSEFTAMLPKRDAHSMVMDAGIVHHLNETGHHKAVVCIVKPKDGDLWRASIDLNLAAFPAQERWWKGTDVGCSSAALFAVFADEPWAGRAKLIGRASTPYDADDFGRCKRLLDIFPEWRPRLGEVTAAYPGTKWQAIVDNWDGLKAMNPKEQTEWLRKIRA